MVLFDKERIPLYNFTCLHSKSFTERNVLGTISLPHCHNSSLNSKFPVVQTHGFGGSFFRLLLWYLLGTTEERPKCSPTHTIIIFSVSFSIVA